MRGVVLANVVRCYVKVALISPRYDSYLNLDEEMIARTPIVNTKSNPKMTEECLDRVYLTLLKYA